MVAPTEPPPPHTHTHTRRPKSRTQLPQIAPKQGLHAWAMAHRLQFHNCDAPAIRGPTTAPGPGPAKFQARPMLQQCPGQLALGSQPFLAMGHGQSPQSPGGVTHVWPKPREGHTIGQGTGGSHDRAGHPKARMIIKKHPKDLL